MSLYRIKGWTENFEGAKSKGYDNKTKCQMPTKHGLGYKKLVRMKNGPALFGAWCALIQVVSRHPKPRYGYLTDTGGIPRGYHAEPEIKSEYSKQNRSESAQPYQPEDLEIMTDIPAKIFEELLKVASVNIGWLEVYEATDTTGIPQGYHGDTTVSAQYPLNSDLDSDLDLDSDSLCSEPVPASEPLIEFPVNPKSDANWIFTTEHLEELKDAFPHIDIMSEVKAALLWIKATPSRRKTRSGMKRFINGWIARTNDKGKYANPNPNQPPHQPAKPKEHFDWQDFQTTMQGYEGYEQVPSDFRFGWANIPGSWIHEYKLRKAAL